MSIYVEARVRGDLEDLWQKTQDPALHQRWDARFSSIEYLPRPTEAEPQRFRYATRIGFGLAIAGEGESVATRTDESGRRTSSLKFWSDDPRSLIRTGAGFWQYTPTDDGIRFVTGYDYQTRFGMPGRVVDRLVFRPLMGWATAWSFDRLRLWVERGVEPGASLQRWLLHWLSRLVVAFVWVYQGLVPKLLWPHADELTMLADAGVNGDVASSLVRVAGGLEVLLGVAVLLFSRQRWPLVATVTLMGLATIGVALSSPRYLGAAFNPVTLNVLLATVALMGLFVLKDVPSAANCLRVKPEGD